MKEYTKKSILTHFREYPKAEIQDLCKFLYQGSFGCKHFAGTLPVAECGITEEFPSAPDVKVITEPLSERFSRVHLSCIKQGLSPKTLATIFCLSAKEAGEADEVFLQKMEILFALIRERKLPFSEAEYIAFCTAWEKDKHSPLHHAEIFRQNYKPAYRVIANKYIPFLPLFTKLDTLLSKGPVKLSIDGGSGSGKTTLSKILHEVYDCTVLHMDDFFLRPEQRTPERFSEIGGNIDRERFLSEVLEPLAKGNEITYRKFDCSTMHLGEPASVTPKKLIVFEGAYSMHPAFESFYDFSVFLDVSEKTQKERIHHRNTPSMAKRFFEEWIPMETVYFTETRIKERCDMVIPIL